jgi:hypothetical protein
MGCLDDEPFGYFEIYWAKENRIAPYYDVDDFDRGWHVLIGEPHMRGKRFVTAWLPSISHYLFLDDDRTQRIVIEPRADNFKMIRNLAQCGYANISKNLIFHISARCLACCRASVFFLNNYGCRAAFRHPILYFYPKDCFMKIYDLIGIGFGPSNIALAITLEEKKTNWSSC